jgi:hypothetical protein
MKGRGIYVVGIRRGDVDIERTRREILRVKGVSGVKFNYLTRKLTVNHDGSQTTLDTVKGVLGDTIRLKKPSPD